MTHHDHSDGAREQIHLPGPSLVPLTTAVGITIALVGLILSWMFVAAGGVIALISIWRWISDVREDVNNLPLEHR